MTPGLPGWLRAYDRGALAGDLTSALVVTVMVIPQALAYAALAGLPPQLGLYAALAPMVAYAALGSSMVMSVGPVAITAVMTAAALEPLAEPGSATYIAGAVLLAFLSGGMLLLMGFLRLGYLARFLSHPVVQGFISGAAVLIILSQIPALLGIDARGATATELVPALLRGLPQLEPVTTAVGGMALGLLVAARRWLAGGLERAGLSSPVAGILARLAPVAVVLAAIAVSSLAGLEGDLRVVGPLPAGLPRLVWPALDPALAWELLMPALVIALVAFVESVAVAQAFARQRGERIDADAELRGLGAANLASAVSGTFPVAGGFSRTAVNADAGARTPLVAVFAAVLLAAVLVWATGVFRPLPQTVLAALIIVTAAGLVDGAGLRRAWQYDRAEGGAFAATAAGVLILGVEGGVITGVALSLLTFIARASNPHLAVVGRVPGTEHFRNVSRYRVETDPGVVLVRVDEILFFGNAEAVREQLEACLAARPAARHLVLVMQSVSHVDATAADVLRELDAGLKQRGVSLHLAEVKGLVMDRLRGTAFMRALGGQVFLSANAAFAALAARPAASAPAASVLGQD